VRKLSLPSKDGMGPLLRGDKLHSGKLRAQKEDRRGFLGSDEAQNGLGPGRQHGNLQPPGQPEGIPTVAFDVDTVAVELNYRECREKNEKNLLPLVMDLTNPTPALGWRTGKDVPAGARAGRCGSGPGSSPPPGNLQQPAFSKNRRFPGPDLPQPGH